MLKKRLSLCLLLLSGCATAPAFEPMDNCAPSKSKPGVFQCTDEGELLWERGSDLVCFHRGQLKEFGEVCHQK